MNQLVPITPDRAPTLVAAPASARRCALGNSSRSTSATSTRAAPTRRRRGNFWRGVESVGFTSIADVKPLHVAAYIEQLGKERSAPRVEQRLTVIWHLFDWFVTGQVMPAPSA